MAGDTLTSPQTPPKTKTKKIKNIRTEPDTFQHFEDDEIIRYAERDEGTDFKQLMAGNIEEYQSESEARAELLTMLAYYCDGPLQIDRIFRKSKLYKMVKEDWNSISESEIRDVMNSCKGHYKQELPLYTKIQVNNRNLPNVSNDVMESLILMNKTKPIIFQRSGKLCRIVRDDDNIPSIEIYNPYSFRGIMGRTADFVKVRNSEKYEREITVFPPMDIVNDILSVGKWPFSKLTSVIATPIVREDGSICTKPGYDPASGIYYDGNLEIDLPENPTQEDAKQAAKFVMDELFQDFPFVKNADKTAVLAGMLTLLIRPMISSAVPMLIITKPTPSTGASLLMDVISHVALGTPCPSTKFTGGNDEETEKRIGSLLLAGTPLIYWDNVDALFGGASINVLLTQKLIKIRVLGMSKMPGVDNTVCTFATGINMQLKGDMPRRSYFCHMESPLVMPWLRDPTKFKHPHLLHWILEHRAELVGTLLLMTRAWTTAGRPKGNCDNSIGGYEDWVEIIDGILTYSGVEDFLGNLVASYQAEDTDILAWGSFLSNLAHHMKSRKFTIKELHDLLAPYDSAPDEILIQFSSR